MGVLLQHSYLRARPLWASVVCVTLLSHYPRETALGTGSRWSQMDSSQAVWARGEEKNSWPSMKKTHEGLIVGNRSFNFPYLHIKCFRASLFISYLHLYMAMETEHQSTIYSRDSGSCNSSAGSAFWRLHGRSIYVDFPRGALVTTRTCRAEWS